MHDLVVFLSGVLVGVAIMLPPCVKLLCKIVCLTGQPEPL